MSKTTSGSVLNKPQCTRTAKAMGLIFGCRDGGCGGKGFSIFNPAEGLAVYFWRGLEHMECTHSQTRAHESWTAA